VCFIRSRDQRLNVLLLVPQFPDQLPRLPLVVAGAIAEDQFEEGDRLLRILVDVLGDEAPSAVELMEIGEILAAPRTVGLVEPDDSGTARTGLEGGIEAPAALFAPPELHVPVYVSAVFAGNVHAGNNTWGVLSRECHGGVLPRCRS